MIKRILSYALEIIVRYIALIFCVFMCGTISVMMEYRTFELIMYTICSFILIYVLLSFGFKISAVRTPIQLKNTSWLTPKTVNIIMATVSILCTVLVCIFVYTFYITAPRAFAGNEHLISSYYQLEAKGYMLLRSLPSTLFVRSAYIAYYNENEYNWSVYNNYYTVDTLFRIIMLFITVLQVAYYELLHVYRLGKEKAKCE